MGSKISKTRVRTEELEPLEWKKIYKNITDEYIINNVEGTIDILERSGLKINRYIE